MQIRKSILCLTIAALSVFTTGCFKSDKSADKPAASVTQVTKESLSDQALGMLKGFIVEDKANLFYFYADWCPVCRANKPVVQEVSKRYADDLNLVFFNYEESKDIAKAINLQGVPKVLLFDEDGEYIQSINGALGEEALTKLIESITD